MTIMIDFPPATLEQLKAEAEATGMDVETFVREAVDARLARRRRTFAEILKPIHDAAQASGMSQEELDKLAEQAVSEGWLAKKRSRSLDGPPEMLYHRCRRAAMHERILIDPAICHGKPVIRGTRTPVTVVLNALAGGDACETVQADYGITAEDVRACIAFANHEMNQQEFHPLAGVTTEASAPTSATER